MAKPVIDLFSLKPENTVFVEAPSPNGATDRTIEAAVLLKTEILTKKTADFVVVNTDGWSVGDEAVQFKTRMSVALAADLVFCM